MRRTLILSALGTTAMLIGLGVGAALASADPVQSSPIAAHMQMADCPMTGMGDMTGMTGMGDMTDMMRMMGSSMMDEQVPATENAHGAHHQEVVP